MNLYFKLTRKLSYILPKKTREEKLFPKLRFAGINKDFEFVIGSKIILAIVLGIIGFILPITLFKVIGITDSLGYTLIKVAEYSFNLPWFVLSIVLGALFLVLPILIYYTVMLYFIQSRAKMVEEVLPDFLYLISNNISAGMTTVSAVSNSARKEFGLLSEEIKIAISKSMGSESFTDSLKELNNRINSQMLKETISFFTESIKSGGKLAKLLENTANDLRQRQELKSELKSSTKMYVMFVLFIILVATPLLLAISVQFLHTIENLQGDGPKNLDSQVAFLGGDLLISPAFMQFMGYIILFVNSLLAGLFLGILMESKATQGTKYFPIIFIVSIVLFSLGNLILPRFLGALG